LSHVLIVDDEPSVLFMLREVLEERGYQVLDAASGVQAAAMADAGQLEGVDLVLSDYSMPGLDGLGLLAHLRPRFPELPLVLLTARGSGRLAGGAQKYRAFD
jgi:two-component system response regulator AtoC